MSALGLPPACDICGLRDGAFEIDGLRYCGLCLQHSKENECQDCGRPCSFEARRCRRCALANARAHKEGRRAA